MYPITKQVGWAPKLGGIQQQRVGLRDQMDPFYYIIQELTTSVWWWKAGDLWRKKELKHPKENSLKENKDKGNQLRVRGETLDHIHREISSLKVKFKETREGKTSSCVNEVDEL